MKARSLSARRDSEPAGPCWPGGQPPEPRAALWRYLREETRSQPGNSRGGPPRLAARAARTRCTTRTSQKASTSGPTMITATVTESSASIPAMIRAQIPYRTTAHDTRSASAACWRAKGDRPPLTMETSNGKQGARIAPPTPRRAGSRRSGGLAGRGAAGIRSPAGIGGPGSVGGPESTEAVGCRRLVVMESPAWSVAPITLASTRRGGEVDKFFHPAEEVWFQVGVAARGGQDPLPARGGVLAPAQRGQDAFLPRGAPGHRGPAGDANRGRLHGLPDVHARVPHPGGVRSADGLRDPALFRARHQVIDEHAEAPLRPRGEAGDDRREVVDSFQVLDDHCDVAQVVSPDLLDKFRVVPALDIDPACLGDSGPATARRGQ